MHWIDNKKMKNNRGQTGLVIFFVLLAVILIVGFVFAILIGAGTWVSSTISPVLQDALPQDTFGTTGQATVGTINTIIQMAPWVIAFLYFFALLGSIMFVLSYNSNLNPMWSGAYFVFMIALIVLAFFISNAYQDVYQANDELGLQLQSMTAISYMILYSPHILAVIMIVAGIFLFAGKQGDSVQGVAGPYGV